MSTFPQPDSIISAMRKPESYRVISEESHKVVNGKILLAEFPYYFHRVKINYGATPLVETESAFPLNDQYQVDYSTRLITFNDDKEGEWVSAKYTGKGFQYFPAGLIWTLLDPTGESVMQTLQDILDAGRTSYTHNQISPANEWVIVHDLHIHPSVTTVDSAGSVTIGDVVYISQNEITINFNSAFSGRAYLN